VLGEVDAEGLEALDVEVLHLGGAGLEDHLELEVLVDAEGVLTVAAVRRASAGFHVGHVPGLGAQGTEESERVHGARALLQVVGLADEAAPVGPEPLQAEDEFLDVHGGSPKRVF